ncbi:hypothetical protein P3T40_003426 [Paraburkholderia sp. EB58]|uniref:DNA N-6-adenine-methyltransferase n=1 Tax=Paraburkholderia sp. EB58 TaxID=3035125 RepID=UPI003D228BC6
MSGMFGERRDAPKHKSVEWYTPGWIFDALGLHFDTDPASPHDMETCVPAHTKYTVFDDGLKQPWRGRVWLNPPYGPTTPQWIRRFIDHGRGIALVFSRTDAAWCQEALRSATAVLFVAGRIEFIPGKENAHKKARAGAGTLMLAFGDDCAEALQRLSACGVFMRGARPEATSTALALEAA